MKKLAVLLMVSVLLAGGNAYAAKKEVAPEKSNAVQPAAEKPAAVKPLEKKAPAAEPAKPAGKVLQMVPGNDARKDADFEAFREKLAQAALAKDKEFLLSHVWADVHNGKEAVPGKDAFVKKWSLEKPADSPIWPALGAIIRLGAKKVQSDPVTYVVPPFLAAWPATGGPNKIESAVIAGEKVNVRADAAKDAEVISKETYTVVKIVPLQSEKTETINGETYTWKKVELPDGKSGFVYGKFVQPVLGQRLAFAKIDKEWMIVAMVNGD